MNIQLDVVFLTKLIVFGAEMEIMFTSFTSLLLIPLDPYYL